MELLRPLPTVGQWRFGTPIGKVGTHLMMIADLLQLVVAVVVLIAVTVLAILGSVAGSDAVAVYGIVLGYAFGVSQGIRAERRDNNSS